MQKTLSWSKKNIRKISSVVVFLFIFSLLSLQVAISPVVSAQVTPVFYNNDAQADAYGNGSNTSDPIYNADGTVSDNSIPFTGKLPQIKEEVYAEVSPEIPQPGETVDISVETYGIDLNKELITWTVDGKTSLRGIGKKTFSFVAGEAGTTNIVRVTISPKNAPDIVKTFTFAPVDVDILWQANTYTPPFYKGKALFTPESNVTFVAMPNIVMNGKRVDSSNIIYNWKIDREVDGDNSGFGKNSYNFTGSILLKPTLIQAEVYAAKDPNYKGLNGFTISHVFPQTLLYENNPLYGIIFNKALRNDYAVKGRDVEISAFPYFFSTPSRSSDLQYEWSLGNNQIALPDYQDSVVFKRKELKDALVSIGVIVKNPTHILQKSISGLNLVYSANQ